MSLIDSASLPLLGIILVAIFSVVIEVGYQVGKRLSSGETGLSKHPVEASVTAAILSLLAFLLAFSFGTGASRYTKMRELTLKDSNIAGTLYLRCDFLPEEIAPEAKSLVREYLTMRMKAVENHDPVKVKKAIERSGEIQSRLWDLGAKARMETNNTAINLYITSMNDLIDNDLSRQSTAFSNRIPKMLWISIGFLGLLATTMLGLSSGLHGRRSRLAATALIVAFTAVGVLIVDLDRPFRTLFVKGDQTAERTLREMEPAD